MMRPYGALGTPLLPMPCHGAASVKKVNILHRLTNLIGVAAVESIHDCWICRPPCGGRGKCQGKDRELNLWKFLHTCTLFQSISFALTGWDYKTSVVWCLTRRRHHGARCHIKPAVLWLSTLKVPQHISKIQPLCAIFLAPLPVCDFILFICFQITTLCNW